MTAEVYSKISDLLQARNYAEIERLCLHALSLSDRPDPNLLFHLGNAARMMGRPRQALVAFEAAVRSAPDDANLLQACASCHQALQNHEAALGYMQRAAGIAPNHPMVLANLAAALEHAGRYSEALEFYNRVLALDPKNLTANLNLGTLLHRLGRKREALQSRWRAAESLPDHPGILFNLAGSLLTHYRYSEAMEYCDRGLAIQPRHAHLIFLKGMVLSCLQQYEQAQTLLSQARVIEPSVVNDFLMYLSHLPDGQDIIVDARGLYLEAMYEAQRSCYWEHRDAYIQTLYGITHNPDDLSWLLSGTDNGFRILSLDIDAQTRLKILSTIASSIAERVSKFAGPAYSLVKKRSPGIRVGYLSPDFRNHATAILARQIFGLHDRNTFEIYAYSLHRGKADDPYTRYISATCDRFFDVSAMGARAIADRIHADGIDILVDLAGYTTYSRSEIMAMRPAPLQFQYLGFPSTMGAGFIDYALIDRTICADGQQTEWFEQVVRLPHALYPYDNEVDNAPTSFSRADFGLPEQAFVFCCLNNSYKIEPRIFERWMNILKAVPDSVLWLLGKGLDIQDHLEREAEQRGVDKSRLVFTERLPLEQHVQRYQLADLFLDTYWHNAHTTAAEALWQGLPLLTVHGEVASARGSSSILYALEMPELVTRDFDEYERLAIYYATHPAEYAAMREKLRAKRYTAPMYNTKLTVRHIEQAYRIAWERHQAGLPPASFDVPEIEDPELRKSIH
ncbi:MAG TPA: tetratricopeptide repeat protein [Methylophilaceae bacterium]|jgi:protein O-GlcNAc transferase